MKTLQLEIRLGLNYYHCILSAHHSYLFHRLINAIDYKGRICGYDPSVKSKSNAYYTTEMTVICIEDCPGETDFEKFYCHDDIDPDTKTLAELWLYVAQARCMWHQDSVSSKSTQHSHLLPIINSPSTIHRSQQVQLLELR